MLELQPILIEQNININNSDSLNLNNKGNDTMIGLIGKKHKSTNIYKYVRNCVFIINMFNK